VQLVGLALVSTGVVVVADQVDRDVVLPLAVDLVRAVADRGLVAGLEVVQAGLRDREEARVADGGREARERLANSTVKVLASTFFRPESSLAFGSGAFSGPSPSGSLPEVTSSMPLILLMKYALFCAFGP
jgi:hypothetical protein